MDLPPRFRRHPRYGNAPHPPRYVHHHLTPPRIFLPPLLSQRHDGQLLFPSQFSPPPYIPIPERSYFQELDPLRKPCLDRYHAPLIPPPRQGNLPFRIIHGYPLRDPIIEDQIFRRGCDNSHAYDLPRTWDRKLPRGSTEGNSRISEMEHRDRYSSSRVSGIEARDMWWKDANADARRLDNGSRELFFAREDDVRGWDCGIDRGRGLSFDRDNDRIRLDYGISDGISLQLENRQQEFLESNLGLHRFSGRLGRKGSKREFHRLRKMNRVQKKSALHKIQLRKARRSYVRCKKNLNLSSLRGRCKTNFECLETITDNQETERSPVDLSISFKSNSLVAKAILAPSSPVPKEDICLSTRNQKIRKINNMTNAGSANSSKVVMEQMPGFQSGVLCPQIELPKNFNVSGNGNVTAYKPNSSKIVTEQMPGFQSGGLCPQIELLEKFNVSGNEASKGMHSHGLNNFISGRRLGRKSKKKNNRMKILHGTRLQFSEDSGEIVNFETSTVSTSDASKLSITSEKVDIGSDTNKPSFQDRKIKNTGLNILYSSLHLSDDVSTECPAKDADCASQLGTDEVTVHAGGSCLANENISVELHVRKWGSILDLEKSLLDSKDLLTSLGAVRVDGINEQPLQDGLVLFESAFDELPFKCPTSVEVEDITGLSRHHESNIPKVQKYKHLSEHHKFGASECENSSCKEVENVVYDKRSADINLKEFFLEPVTIPEIEGYCSSNPRDAKISVAAAVADCSSLSLGTATRSKFLSADHKGTVAEADISLVKTVGQSYQDRANLSNKSGCIEGTSESKIKRKKRRKRKARGTQLGISGSNATEPFDKGSSVDDELANLLATDISFVKKTDFPGAADNSEVKFSLTEGPSVEEDSHLDSVDFSGDGAFPGNIKKRKVVSPRLNFSSCLVDDSIGNCLASNYLKPDQVSLRLPETDISLVKTVSQSYKDGANLSNKSGCIEGTSESKIKRKRKRKRKGKRKARGTQLGISGSNATEPFDKGGSVDVELANLLATDISFVKEADFPGAADNSEVKFSLKEGPSVDEDSHLDAVDFSGEGAFPGNIKKKKVVSPRLNFSSCLVDDSIGNCLASNDLKLDQVSLRLPEADISLVKTVSQSYKDGANLSNRSGCIEGTSESKIKRKRKRKARGTQLGISGSNATEPFDKGSSVDDELANLLATDISFVKEADFPGAADNSEMKFSLKEGPSVNEDSHLDAVDFSGDGAFPGNIKMRTMVSPRLNFSSCLVDDSIGDCLASDDLKLDQVSLRLAEQDTDQSEGTLSAMHLASIDGSENFSIPEMDGTLVCGDNNVHLKDDLAFIGNTLSMCANGCDDRATQSGDELVASGFDTPSCVSSPDDLLSHTDFHSESEMIFEEFQTSNIKPVSRHSITFSLRKPVENATSGHLQIITKVPPSLPQKTDKVPSSKNKLTSAVPNIFSGHPASNFHISRKFPSTYFSKSRTWHRTDQLSTNVTGSTIRPCSLPQSRAPKTPMISQSSYVRKGNTLVRKPSSSGVTAAHTLSSSVYPTRPCMDYLKKNQVKVDTPCIPRIGQVNTSESSQSLLLNHTGRSLRSASCHSVESLPVTNSLGSGGPAKTLDALKDVVKSFEIPECQTSSGNNSDSLSTPGKENLGKKISYVKRRSNQLIATSDSKDLSTPKSQTSSDGYYKNSKNQLIRVSSESHARKGDSMATLNSHRLGSQTILPLSFGKRQSSKGFAKTYKLSKFPLAWNLNGALLPNKSSNSSEPHKVWPYLFPWRRLTYRRSSLPTISQKLLLSSKRGAIYTRSTHGNSLRISKVLSVCGRSLKWSKSIERSSKKANEEATRAVAAAEKRKKEGKGAISVLSKSRINVSRKSVVIVKLCPGERIFRIGSERYKMDPSRRSLHRITEEEEPSPSDVLQSENNFKKSYVPRRLLIGNDEYVRIGTGNQLVRDPKKRTRVLASEKVRWSLRTARLRLARKRKYCQFFTRFGKCNKSDGKCPYIHDSSKIAVCTKFLNGSCTDSDCKLTHKVIPERMPDCSYFLKGSCFNENCPYRHVNVNSESSICKRFLRGYCADGNECRKKHTYVCPAFESTGICPRSFMCKLHHPKRKTEKKPVNEQKIVRGRYFDGGLMHAAECSMATGEKLYAEGEDDMVCEEGKYPDYISLDITNDDPQDEYIMTTS